MGRWVYPVQTYYARGDVRDGHSCHSAERNFCGMSPSGPCGVLHSVLTPFGMRVLTPFGIRLLTPIATSPSRINSLRVRDLGGIGPDIWISNVQRRAPEAPESMSESVTHGFRMFLALLAWGIAARLDREHHRMTGD